MILGSKTIVIALKPPFSGNFFLIFQNNSLVRPQLAYGWRCPREDAKPYEKKDALEEIWYWTDRVTAKSNRGRLEGEGLGELANLATKMINEERKERLTIREAYRRLKQGVRKWRKGKMREGEGVLEMWQKSEDMKKKMKRKGPSFLK